MIFSKGQRITGNTLKAETYIEEGYLPRWKDYMKWQTGTINRSLVILEDSLLQYMFLPLKYFR